jgi:hypothetical protein
LTRLKPHWGYLALASGARTDEAVWFERRFVTLEHAAAALPDIKESPDPLQQIVEEVKRSRRSPDAHVVMAALGYQPRLTIDAWRLAVELCQPQHPRSVLVERAAKAFESVRASIPAGLANLPTPWLAGIPGILKEFMEKGLGKELGISRVDLVNGALQLEYRDADTAEGADDGGRSANSLMAQWNLRLYPCLWRRLSRRHQRRLKSIVL